MRCLSDYHHSSLLRSTVMLFEERLGFDVFRPIGMDWFKEGFWAINSQEDTARQFLDIDSQPTDGTPPLNKPLARDNRMNDCFKVRDPGDKTHHWACTLDHFKRVKFDYVIASIPAHVEPFKRLIAKYNPEAKLIIQMGNNWNLDYYEGENVLASIEPRTSRANAIFYHQEFDLDIFSQTPVPISKKIHSYVNVIGEIPMAWNSYDTLKKHLEPRGWEVKSFGGQCPDGNMTGPVELADSMYHAEFILHVKPQGDGYGHILHNAYAMGRPVITHSRHYQGQLGSRLLMPGTFIDIDCFGGIEGAMAYIENMPDEEVKLMGQLAYERFKEVVDFESEAKAIGEWLETL